MAMREGAFLLRHSPLQLVTHRRCKDLQSPSQKCNFDKIHHDFIVICREPSWPRMGFRDSHIFILEGV
jgi:hypothetical protein